MAALFFLIPIWVVGPLAYPHTQYGAVVLAVGVDSIIGLNTRTLVIRVRNQVREARVRERLLEQVSEVVHGLFDSPQPRQDACEAVMTISSATSRGSIEPMANSDQLICIATAGMRAEVEAIIVPRRSAANEAMRTRRAVLITEDVKAHIGLIDAWIAAERPSSLVFSHCCAGDTHSGC